MITSQKNYDIIIENVKKELKNMKDTNSIWEEPRYSKNQINKAGKILSTHGISSKERNDALVVLNNWRASHAYPLQEIYNILKENNPNAIVVQRLKRLDSIVGKIERFQDMSLYRMQDLGGCRVIVETIDQIYKAIETFKNLDTPYKFKRENDYIENPKTSGYRSYHLVYKYHNNTNDTYNKNMLIEIQFRTQLQHIWATAVEMMGTYTKSNLKSSMGDKDILRFFTIVSSIFAILEDKPVCPQTSDNIQSLILELKQLDKKHNILSNLESLNKASQIINSDNDQKRNMEDTEYFDTEYYLLILNPKQKLTSIYGYSQKDYKLANGFYEQVEKLYSDMNIVLVTSTSIDELKAAYPNYFSDISKFITILEDSIKFFK